MDKVTLYVEKSEPYCVFLDFVDRKEFFAFERACPVGVSVMCNENCSMLCIKNISMTLKRKLRYADTFQVSLKDLAKLPWQSANMSSVRYELDISWMKEGTFESILPTKRPR